jgi:subtilisin family serine protease
LESQFIFKKLDLQKLSFRFTGGLVHPTRLIITKPKHVTKSLTLMRKISIVLSFLVLTMFACDQDNSITSPEQHESENVFDVRGISGDAAHSHIPGRFIVTLEPGNNPAQVASEYDIEPDYEYHKVLLGFAGEISEAAKSGLMKDHRVVRVERDGVVTTTGTVQEDATWGLDRIDQRELPLDGNYIYTNEGSGATAYILDTGIRYSHDEFQGRVSFGFDAFGDDGDDCNGHGTHVAGTVGGAEYGVAKDVNLVAVRVLDCEGSGSWSGVIAGMDWVAENASGTSVANMSLGGGANESIDEAVERMYDSGVPTIVAAGNGDFLGRAQDACNYSPARADQAYTVGATTDSDSKTSWSNYGDCVDIFAPGANITAAWHTGDTATNTISGTSMAAPHVAGVAALFLEDNPNATSDQVYDAITEYSTKNIVTSSNTENNHLLYSLFDDDGSGGDDGNGDNGDDGDNGEVGDNDPVIDSFNVNFRTSGPWNRAEVSWAVSDEDGDLSSVTIELLSGSDVLDSQSVNVSGSSASGDDELRSRTSPDSVRLTVTDEQGNTTTETSNY